MDKKKFRNIGVWIGDVVSLYPNMDKGFNVNLMVENISPRDGQAYQDVLPVRVEDADALLKFEEGRKIGFLGVLNIVDIQEDGKPTKSTVIHCDPSTVQLIDKKAALEKFCEKVGLPDPVPYVNHAEISGELRDKQCFNDDPDKQPWGYCLMRLSPNEKDTRLFRASFFRNVFRMMTAAGQAAIRRGSNLSHGGPLRYREYEVRENGVGTGKMRKMLELLSQDDHFAINELFVPFKLEANAMAYTGFDPNDAPKTKTKK